MTHEQRVLLFFQQKANRTPAEIAKLLALVEIETYRKVLELLEQDELKPTTAAALEPVAAFGMAKASLARQLKHKLGFTP